MRPDERMATFLRQQRSDVVERITIALIRSGYLESWIYEDGAESIVTLAEKIALRIHTGASDAS